MIRHIVFFTAADPADAARIRDLLRPLAGIPHSLAFEVALNRKADALSSEVDVVVYAEFADEAALAAYKADPVYAATTSVVRPLRDRRIAADIMAEDTPTIP